MRNIYHIAPKRSGHAWIGNMIKSWIPGDVYHDCENKLPEKFKINPKGVVVVLQTRDLLNWYASCYHQRKRLSNKIVLKWITITREFYFNRHLKQYEVVHILYDDFFRSEEYRQSICRKLGGVYTNERLNVVLENGNGSSFDGYQFDGAAQEMNVLSRYKQVPSEIYIELFQINNNLKRLYLKYMANDDQRKFIKQL